MYYTAYLLAWRYLFGRKDEFTINTMMYICFFSIMIGTGALTLSLCIMNGFEKTTYHQLKGIHSDITMSAYGQSLDVQAIQEVLHNEFPTIIASSPYTTKQIIIQTVESDDISQAIAFKAIDPIQESRVSSIQQKITSEVKDLVAIIQNKQVLIGQNLAEQLAITLGDTIFLLFPNDQESGPTTIKLHKESAVVAGIFKSGIDEFDSNVIYGSFDLMKKIEPESEPTHLSMHVSDVNNYDTLINGLKKRFGLDAYSWKDLYPAIVAALKLEKYVMLLILGLIVLLASMNIASLLFMYITYKKRDIGILYAIGAPSQLIYLIFLMIGMTIVFIASIIGILIAVIIGFLLQTYPFIVLPDTYYVTHIPVDIDFLLCVYIELLVLVLSLIAIGISMQKIKYMNIARILRFEA